MRALGPHLLPFCAYLADQFRYSQGSVNLLQAIKIPQGQIELVQKSSLITRRLSCRMWTQQVIWRTAKRLPVKTEMLSWASEKASWLENKFFISKVKVSIDFQGCCNKLPYQLNTERKDSLKYSIHFIQCPIQARHKSRHLRYDFYFYWSHFTVCKAEALWGEVHMDLCKSRAHQPTLTAQACKYLLGIEGTKGLFCTLVGITDWLKILTLQEAVMTHLGETEN